MTSVKIDTRCGHFYPNTKRCKYPGNPCWLEYWEENGEPSEYLCDKHMFLHGYCPGCGLFWGGVESFEFSDLHLCDNCADQVRSDFAEDDEEDDYWPGGDLP